MFRADGALQMPAIAQEAALGGCRALVTKTDGSGPADEVTATVVLRCLHGRPYHTAGPRAGAHRGRPALTLAEHES
jgi:hypothetical protein